MYPLAGGAGAAARVAAVDAAVAGFGRLVRAGKIGTAAAASWQTCREIVDGR
jgi:hypothetical protein